MYCSKESVIGYMIHMYKSTVNCPGRYDYIITGVHKVTCTIIQWPTVHPIQYNYTKHTLTFSQVDAGKSPCIPEAAHTWIIDPARQTGCDRQLLSSTSCLLWFVFSFTRGYYKLYPLISNSYFPSTYLYFYWR